MLRIRPLNATSVYCKVANEEASGEWRHYRVHTLGDGVSKGRRVQNRKATFQKCNDLNGISWVLQVWKVKDHSKCTFYLDIDCITSLIPFDGIDLTYLSTISLAPDDLTLITQHPILWNHDTAQFHCIHFTNEVHLGYSILTWQCLSCILTWRDSLHICLARTTTSESETHELVNSVAS